MAKKIIVLALAVLIISNYSQSQDAPKKDNQGKFIFGLKANANFSWYKPDSRSLEKGGFKTGSSYGIMGDYMFLPNYSFNVEILVSSLNGKLTYKEDYPTFKIKDSVFSYKDVSYEYTNKYIQVPLCVKFRTKEIGKMKYFAQFGFAPAFLVSAKAKIKGSNLPWEEDEIKKVKTNEESEDIYQFSNFDDDVSFIVLPLVIGGGTEMKLSGSTSLMLGLRFENGFNDILKSNGTTIFSKNISLSAGIFF